MHPRKYFYGFFAPFSALNVDISHKNHRTDRDSIIIGKVRFFLLVMKQLKIFERPRTSKEITPDLYLAG